MEITPARRIMPASKFAATPFFCEPSDHGRLLFESMDKGEILTCIPSEIISRGVIQIFSPSLIPELTQAFSPSFFTVVTFLNFSLFSWSITRIVSCSLNADIGTIKILMSGPTSLSFTNCPILRGY